METVPYEYIFVVTRVKHINNVRFGNLILRFFNYGNIFQDVISVMVPLIVFPAYSVRKKHTNPTLEWVPAFNVQQEPQIKTRDQRYVMVMFLLIAVCTHTA